MTEAIKLVSKYGYNFKIVSLKDSKAIYEGINYTDYTLGLFLLMMDLLMKRIQTNFNND